MKPSDLSRLELSLSPQQAALHFWGPLLQARDPTELTALSWDAHEAEDAHTRIEQVKASATAAMRGRPRDEVQEAERRAVSEYFFVYGLLSQVNQSAAHAWEAWVLRFLLMVTQANVVDSAWIAAWCGEQEGRGVRVQRAKQESEHARFLLAQSTAIFTGTRRAVEEISRTYAGGGPVLFAGAVHQLESGEVGAALLEEALSERYPEVTTERHAGVDETARALSELWVSQARWDLHTMRGEDDAAHAILAERVHRMRS